MALSSEITSLECSICKEVLIDPRALPCGHSYCGKPRFCLNSLQDPSEKLICAICRAEHNIRVEDVKPLYGIREFFLKPCSSRTGSHSNGNACKFHPNLTDKFWCTKCDTSICVRCVDENHDGHSVRNLARHLEEQCQMKEDESFPGGLSAYSERAREYIEQIDIELQLARDRLSALEKARTVAVEKKETVDHLPLSLSDFKSDNVLKFINLDPDLPLIGINVAADASSSIHAERISKIGNPQIVNLNLFIKRGEPIATQQLNQLSIFGKAITINGLFRSGKNNSQNVAIRFSKPPFQSKSLADERVVLVVCFRSRISGSSKVHNFKPQMWTVNEGDKEINTFSTDDILNPDNCWLASDNLKVTVSVFACTVSHIIITPQNKVQ